MVNLMQIGQTTISFRISWEFFVEQCRNKFERPGFKFNAKYRVLLGNAYKIVILF